MKFWQCFSYKQTWAFAFGKFMTDGVWWFFLFWTPSYLNTQFGIKTSEGLGIALIFTLYAITMLSIYGGKLPTIIINRTGLNPYAARMRAMLIFAFFPLKNRRATAQPRSSYLSNRGVGKGGLSNRVSGSPVFYLCRPSGRPQGDFAYGRGPDRPATGRAPILHTRSETAER